MDKIITDSEIISHQEAIQKKKIEENDRVANYYFKYLLRNFNNTRLEDGIKTIYKIDLFYELNQHKSYITCLKIFDNFLRSHDYKIIEISHDSIHDSCPDFTNHKYIYIAKKDYNPDYSWYEKILEFIGLYNKIEYDYLNQEN